MPKRAAIIAFVALLPAAALADSAIPDLRGTWKGTSESVVLGRGTPMHPATRGTEPEFRAVEFTMTVTRQEGRRFVATFASATHQETIVGVISRSGTIHVVDDDGIDTGTLLAPDRLEMCYQHLSEKAQIASCTELVKQR